MEWPGRQEAVSKNLRSGEEGEVQQVAAGRGHLGLGFLVGEVSQESVEGSPVELVKPRILSLARGFGGIRNLSISEDT